MSATTSGKPSGCDTLYQWPQADSPCPYTPLSQPWQTTGSNLKPGDVFVFNPGDGHPWYCYPHTPGLTLARPRYGWPHTEGPYHIATPELTTVCVIGHMTMDQYEEFNDRVYAEDSKTPLVCDCPNVICPTHGTLDKAELRQGRRVRG